MVQHLASEVQRQGRRVGGRWLKGNENVNMDFLPQIPFLGAWKSVFSRCGTRGLCVPSKKHAVRRLE